MSGRNWERIAAIFGILFFVTVLVNFGTPETPDVDDPTAKIVGEIADDRDGHVLSVYLLFLGALFFLVFVGGLWSRLRRAELEPGASVLVVLGGLGTALVVLVAGTVYLSVVDAADAGREPAAVRALFELDETVFTTLGIPSSAFYAGIALSALGTRSLPAWLGWIAAALAVLFPITLLGIFSESDEGGVLGGVFFGAFIVNFLWILAASIVMLMREGTPSAERSTRVGAPAPPPPPG
jgi:hypothetical protein